MSKNAEIKTRWYYDACTLDGNLYEDIFREVTSKHCPKLAVLSHLALGEAYGNLLEKKSKLEMNAFTDFLDKLKLTQRVLIVGNDEVEDIHEKIVGAMPARSSLTDTIHIATAIKNECCNILSDDQDLTGIDKVKKDKIKKVARQFGVEDFSITWLKRNK